MTDHVAPTPRHRLGRAVVGMVVALLPAATSAQDATTTAEQRAWTAFGGGAPEATGETRDAAAAAAARAAAEGLGVELLGARSIEVRGRSLVAARVMEPGGNSNAAFLVQTLIVDPESGRVLGVFPGTEAELGSLPDPTGLEAAADGEGSPTEATAAE